MQLRKLLTVSYNEIAVHLFVKTKDLLRIKKEGRKGKNRVVTWPHNKYIG